MKNKIFKALLFVLTVSLLITVTAVSAFAAENTEEGESTAAGASSGTAENGDVGGISFWASLYGGVSENLGEIFCALTLIGSITLALAYKKGLLPIMTKALGAIGGSVGKLGEDAAGFSAVISERTERLENSLAEARDIIAGFQGLLEGIADELSQVKSEGEMIAHTERILKEQTEMLYELLMSSSLPQYQKDAVAMKLSDMRKDSKKEA